MTLHYMRETLMSTGDICEDLKRRANLAGLELSIDSSSGVWYAVIATRADSYQNLLVRSFEANSLEELARQVRFPVRTPDGWGVYV